jgi:hypothetical protein
MTRARWGWLAGGTVIVLAGLVGAIIAVTGDDSEKSASVRSASTADGTTGASVITMQPSGTSLAPHGKFVMTALGLGDARFGMTLADASAALGVQLVPNRFTPACADIGVLPLSTFGVSSDRVTWFATQSPDAYTESGLHVGSTTMDVQAAYPAAARRQETNGPRPLVARDSQGNQFVFYDGATDATPDKTGSVVQIKVVPASTSSAGLPTTCD